MGRIVAVAPTLSDAVHSAGGTLAGHAASGHTVVVVAVFADEERATANAICAVLGLEGVVSVGLPVDAESAAVGAAIALALSRLEPTLVLSPIGLTGLDDVRAINDALDALDVPRLRWLDLPYGSTRTPGAPLGGGAIVAVPIDDHLDAKIAACRTLGAVEPERLRDHARSEGERLGTGVPVEVLLDPVAPAAV